MRSHQDRPSAATGHRRSFLVVMRSQCGRAVCVEADTRSPVGMPASDPGGEALMRRYNLLP